jgi:hypothetical protein
LRDALAECGDELRTEVIARCLARDEDNQRCIFGSSHVT